MPYIFGKLWHLAIIWAIRKAFQCILQGVRILLAKYTRISPTSENDSYTSEHHISTDTLKLTKSQTREARFTLTRVCDEENLGTQTKSTMCPLTSTCLERNCSWLPATSMSGREVRTCGSWSE